LTISKDQSDAARGLGNGYSGGWNVNEGQLTLGVMGALGNAGTAAAPNVVNLNGSTVSGAAQLNLTVPTANPLNVTYTSGRIVAVDNATLNFDPGATDRTQTINDVELQSTGGSLLDAQLKVLFTNNRARSILQAGTFLLSSGNGQVNVAYGTNVSESVTSGFSVARLAGTGNLTKWGAATMYIRGDSTAATSALDGTAYSAYTVR
jgi:hypothetical protein